MAKKKPARPSKAAPKKKAAAKRAAPRRKARIVSRPRAYAPGPAILDEATLALAVAGLRERDPLVVDAMLELGGHPPLRRREPGFAGLAWIVVGQQVSVASANAIYGRLNAAFPQLEAAVLVAAILATGISGSSARTSALGDNPITASAVDKIVRTTKSDVPTATAALRDEVSRTLMSNLARPSLADADRAYLAGVVETRSGISGPGASERVTEAFAQLKTATNRARKAGIVMGFLVAATLLVGAATAWWAAGVGGDHRDQGTVWQPFARHSLALPARSLPERSQ